MATINAYASSNAADGALAGWTNPTNVYADDGTYSTRQGTSKNTRYGTLFGFDLSELPDGATINGVTLSAEWHNSANDASGPVLLLGAKSGGEEVGSSNDTTGQTGDEVFQYQPTGLTAAELKATGDSGFWAILRFRRTDNTAHTASCDYVYISIDYTVPVVGTLSNTLDNITLQATGTVETSEITGTLSATLGSIAFVALGEIDISGELTKTLDGVSATLTGVVLVGGGLSKTLDGVVLSAVGVIVVLGTLDTTLTGVSLSSAGTVGEASITGSLDKTLDGIGLSAAGSAERSGSVNVVLDGLAISSAGRVVLFEYWNSVVGTGEIAKENVFIRGVSTAAKLTAGSSADTYISQTVSITPNTDARFQVWTRGDGDNCGRFAIYNVSDAEYLFFINETSARGTAYTLISAVFSIPVSCTSVQVQLYCPVTNGGVCYFSEPSLRSKVR